MSDLGGELGRSPEGAGRGTDAGWAGDLWRESFAGAGASLVPLRAAFSGPGAGMVEERAGTRRARGRRY